MSYLDELTANSSDLTAQSEALTLRRQRLAEEARAAAQQIGIYAPPPQPEQGQGFRSAVTGAQFLGAQPRTSVLGALTPLIARARLGYDESQTDAAASDFRQRVQQDALKRLQSMPQGTPGGDPLQGPTPDGSQLRTVAQPASLRDTLGWAMGLQGNPQTADVGKEVIKNQLVTLPQKQAEQVLEYLKLTEQHRHNTAEEGKPIAVPQVGLFKPDGRGGYEMVVQTPDKPLGEGPAKDWRETSVQIGQIDDALALLRSPAGKNATGLWQGAVNAVPGIGTTALNLFDPEGRATRALVSQIASMKIKNTSGTAVAASEEARLKPWVPQVGDDNDTVIMKLEGFRREYSKMLDEIAKQAKQQGQKSPGAPASMPVPGSDMLRQPDSTAPTSSTGYTPPKPGSVDTAPLEAEYRATKDPLVAQRLMSAGVPVVETREQRDALPRGTRYLDAQGNAAVKR